LLGKRWAGLDEQHKLPFQNQADDDRLRYKKEMESFIPAFEQFKSGTLKLSVRRICCHAFWHLQLLCILIHWTFLLA
jgi:hypothetical protein